MSESTRASTDKPAFMLSCIRETLTQTGELNKPEQARDAVTAQRKWLAQQDAAIALTTSDREPGSSEKHCEELWLHSWNAELAHSSSDQASKEYAGLSI